MNIVKCSVIFGLFGRRAIVCFQVVNSTYVSEKKEKVYKGENFCLGFSLIFLFSYYEESEKKLFLRQREPSD